MSASFSRLCWGLVIALSMLLTGCRGESVVRSTADFPPGRGFVECEYTVDGTQKRMWVFVPLDYDDKSPKPAIVFLHGLFEAGHDGSAALSAGLGPVIARNPAEWRFITLFPQSDGTWRGEERDRLVIAALDYARDHWNIDDDRVILAGLSYGALGTWEIGARHPDRFAALVPVSGHRATELIERLILLPVWAFHFRGDPIVDSLSSEEMCRKIDEKGGHARLTEFKGVGHDCWDRAIDESELVAWMLQQRRREPAVAGVDRDSGY